jgi:hypothetical protein
LDCGQWYKYLDLHRRSASVNHVVTSVASAVSNCNTHKRSIVRRQERSSGQWYQFWIYQSHPMSAPTTQSVDLRARASISQGHFCVHSFFCWMVGHLHKQKGLILLFFFFNFLTSVWSFASW